MRAVSGQVGVDLITKKLGQQLHHEAMAFLTFQAWRDDPLRDTPVIRLAYQENRRRAYQRFSCTAISSLRHDSCSGTSQETLLETIREEGEAEAWPYTIGTDQQGLSCVAMRQPWTSYSTTGPIIRNWACILKAVLNGRLDFSNVMGKYEAYVETGGE